MIPKRARRAARRSASSCVGKLAGPVRFVACKRTRPLSFTKCPSFTRMRPCFPAGASSRWLMFTTLFGASYEGTNGNIPSSPAISVPTATAATVATNFFISEFLSI